MSLLQAQSYFDQNRKRWDALVDAHAQSKFYDLQGFKAGQSSLKHPELDLMGDVADKSLLHLQCHFGQDTLSWARMGAQVTGVDFSPKAIDLARNLAQELSISARFVCCNVYDFLQQSQQQHDIVFTSYGGIPWLPDLEAWADIVVQCLKPGGQFVLVEFHPAWMMLDFNTQTIAYSYFNPGSPYVEVAEGSYTDTAGQEPVVMEECFWNHSLAEVIQPLLNRGLRLEAIREYDHSVWNCFPNLEEYSAGRYRAAGRKEMLPMMFGIRMRKA
jgi:ubiquinone/menaquinone biosynthesis C-methylase UbiE